MNRLTKDLHNQYKDYWYREDLDQVCDKEQIALTKLGQLEDIEEDIGIDLITLFEIYKQLNTKKEVWFKYEKEMDEELKFMNSHRHKWVSYLIDFKCKAFVEMEYEPVYYFYFKDYGKTWALTKEELKERK